LTRLTTAHPSKPVMITEFGTDEHPNRASGKAEWIADMYKVVNETKSIVGIVWFDINKERDWRIGSSAQSAAAFGAGARSSL
jgi:mannan endo-1,4-beta-mannosidase